VNDWKTEWRCRSERALLRILEGGCSVPVAVQTSLSPSTASTPPGGDWKLHLAATVTSLSGDKEVSASLERIVSSAREAEAIGVEVAAQLLGGGATDILDEIKKIKEAAGKS
jgi:hydroxymethylbilane synthase